MDIEDFLEELDDMTHQAARARHEDFAQVMRRWFAVFEEAPPAIRDRVRWLMTVYPWVENEAILTKEQSGMGNSQLLWPDAKERRLSAQLTLFREFAEERIKGYQFAFEYFSTSSRNINETLHQMTEHLFEPHVVELKRYLVRNADKPITEDAFDLVPASDRIVRLDHNQPGYEETLRSIEDTSTALIGDNSIGPEDRERIKFELESGMLLLKGQTVRMAAVEAVLISSLKWLAKAFGGAALGIAAEDALQAVLLLLNS